MSRRTLKKLISRILPGVPRLRPRLAVLTYHSLGNGCPESLGAELFETHMSYLASQGRFTIVDWAKRNADSKLDEPGVLVTFDDGYLDNWQIALPILNRLNIRALFFICTRFVDEGGPAPDWWGPYRGLPPMNWDQVNQLVAAGHSIGFHGHTHKDFGKFSTREARDELSTSAELFRRHCNTLPDAFAYPYGQFEHRRADMAELAQSIGFRYVFSTENRSIDQQAMRDNRAAQPLPRLRVDAGDEIGDIRQMLEGRRDYVALIQRSMSAFRSRSLQALKPSY